MNSDLTKILLLQLSSTISPMIFSISLIILSDKKTALKNIFAFFIGSLSVVIIVAFLGVPLGDMLATIKPNNNIRIIINLILAIILIYLSIHELIAKKSNKKQDEISKNSPNQFGKWVALGFALNATNLNSLIANFTALKEISVAQFNPVLDLILILFGMACFTFPILVPMLIYLVAPKVSQKILRPIDKLMTKYGNYLIALIFIIIASVFLHNVYNILWG